MVVLGLLPLGCWGCLTGPIGTVLRVALGSFRHRIRRSRTTLRRADPTVLRTLLTPPPRSSAMSIDCLPKPSPTAPSPSRARLPSGRRAQPRDAINRPCRLDRAALQPPRKRALQTVHNLWITRPRRGRQSKAAPRDSAPLGVPEMPNDDAALGWNRPTRPTIRSACPGSIDRRSPRPRTTRRWGPSRPSTSALGGRPRTRIRASPRRPHVGRSRPQTPRSQEAPVAAEPAMRRAPIGRIPSCRPMQRTSDPVAATSASAMAWDRS